MAWEELQSNYSRTAEFLSWFQCLAILSEAVMKTYTGFCVNISDYFQSSL